MAKYKESSRNTDKIDFLKNKIDTECEVELNGKIYKAIVRSGRSETCFNHPKVLRILELDKGQEFKKFSKNIKCLYVKEVNSYKRPIQYASELYTFIRTFKELIKEKRLEQ